MEWTVFAGANAVRSITAKQTLFTDFLKVIAIFVLSDCGDKGNLYPIIGAHCLPPGTTHETEHTYNELQEKRELVGGIFVLNCVRASQGKKKTKAGSEEEGRQ